MNYEKPVVMIEEDYAEGVFLAGSGKVTITSADADLNFNWLIADTGTLKITKLDYLGRDGTVTLKVTAVIFNWRSDTLYFDDQPHKIPSNGLVTIELKNIKKEYTIYLDTGNVSWASTNSVNSRTEEIYIEIVG